MVRSVWFFKFWVLGSRFLLTAVLLFSGLAGFVPFGLGGCLSVFSGCRWTRFWSFVLLGSDDVSDFSVLLFGLLV